MNDYDKYLIMPRPSSVNSRDDVDLSVRLPGGLTLSIPIIASPMQGIVGPEIVEKMGRLGGLGILPRFYEGDLWREHLGRLKRSRTFEGTPFGVAIGLGDYQELKWALEAKASLVCIDIANGYLQALVEFIRKIKPLIPPEVLLMAGNIVDGKVANSLYNAGVDLVRVGIGTGALCTTRMVTGIGRDQVSALQEVALSKGPWGVADGGIRASGDIVKALVAGARLVMIGTLWARTYESPHDGFVYGSASRRLQEEYFHSVKSVEGREVEVEKDISLEDLVNELSYGIRSACTYVGAFNLEELHQKATLTRVFV